MRDFAEKVALEIRMQNELDAEVFSKDMPDGSKKYGVSIRKPDENISPVIYVESFKEKGLTVEQTVKEMLKIYDEAMMNTPDVSLFSDWEKAKERLVVRLMPNTFNAEVKRSARAYGFDDLILVPYVNMQDGSIEILNQHIKYWGVTKRKVIDIAVKNTKNKDVVIEPLGTFVPEIFGLDIGHFDELDKPLIVTNKDDTFGASAILGAIGKIKRKFKDGFFVLPASVHEVIVLPASMGTKEHFDMLVNEVNRGTVSSTERLSNHAYAFN